MSVSHDDSLEQYLAEISSFPLLGRAEEAALIRRIRDGDTDAVEKLVRHHLRFVVSVAKSYQGLGLTMSELLDEGNLGLIRAAHASHDAEEPRFASHAVWWIRQEILTALDRGPALANHHLLDFLPVEDGEEPPPGSLHGLTPAAAAALGALKPVEIYVLRLSFGLDGEPPMRAGEVGARLGIGERRTRRIRARGLRRLRRASGRSAPDRPRWLFIALMMMSALALVTLVVVIWT